MRQLDIFVDWHWLIDNMNELIDWLTDLKGLGTFYTMSTDLQNLQFEDNDTSRKLPLL